MRVALNMALFLVLCELAGCCSKPDQPKAETVPGVWAAPPGELTYPRNVTPEQTQLLTELGDLKWFTPVASKEYGERTQRQFAELLGKIQNARLPGLASPQDIRISQSEIKNTSNRDVLIVLQHETGRDVAVRTHWLPAGKSIPNRSAFAGWGKVWIIAPQIKGDTEPTVRGGGKPAPQP